MGRLDIERLCPETLDVRLRSSGERLAFARVATGPLARAVGLLATPALPIGCGLLIPRCSSVHTVGMRYAIACVWVGGEGRVLRVDDPVRPGRLARCAGAAQVLEAPTGSAERVGCGDVLLLIAPAGPGDEHEVSRDSRNLRSLRARGGGDSSPLTPLSHDGSDGPAAIGEEWT